MSENALQLWILYNLSTYSIRFVDYPSLISAKRIAIIFITADIITFLVQVIAADCSFEKRIVIFFYKTIDFWSYPTFKQNQRNQYYSWQKYFVSRFDYSNNNICFLYYCCHSFWYCCGKEWTSWWQMETANESFVCSLFTCFGNYSHCSKI